MKIQLKGLSHFNFKQGESFSAGQSTVIYDNYCRTSTTARQPCCTDGAITRKKHFFDERMFYILRSGFSEEQEIQILSNQ